ncbi:hypothetical protein Tco_0622798 [Tanacetum coccineum]
MYEDITLYVHQLDIICYRYSYLGYLLGFNDDCHQHGAAERRKSSNPARRDMHNISRPQYELNDNITPGKHMISAGPKASMSFSIGVTSRPPLFKLDDSVDTTKADHGLGKKPAGSCNEWMLEEHEQQSQPSSLYWSGLQVVYPSQELNLCPSLNKQVKWDGNELLVRMQTDGTLDLRHVKMVLSGVVNFVPKSRVIKYVKQSASYSTVSLLRVSMVRIGADSGKNHTASAIAVFKKNIGFATCENGSFRRGELVPKSRVIKYVKQSASYSTVSLPSRVKEQVTADHPWFNYVKVKDPAGLLRKGKAKKEDGQPGEWALPTVKAKPITDEKEEPILMVGVINNPLKWKEPPKIMSVEEMIFPYIRNRAPSVDPILISVQVYRRQVGRVLLDGRAACDIIYEHCFLKLRKEVREMRKDVYTTLSGFSGEQVNPLGEISLLITVGEAPHHRSEHITFLIVRSDSPQNMLLERTVIAELGTIPSTMHSAVLYQSKEGPRVIMSAYQDKRRREQVKILKESLSEAPLEVSECVNPEEKVIANHRYPEQTVTIRRQLPTQFKQKLVKLLRSNAYIFAWEYSDMTGIPRTLKIGSEIFITENKLNKDKKTTPVQQKKRGMAPERSAAASKEVEELKKARILRETRNQTWAANTVMVKKTDGA